MSPETRITLAVLRDQFEKDLAQAMSNYTGADYGTDERLQLEGVIATLRRAIQAIDSHLGGCNGT